MLTHTIFEVYFYQAFFSFTTYLFIIKPLPQGGFTQWQCLSVYLFVCSFVCRICRLAAAKVSHMFPP